jgi:hypothetical protein
MITSPCRPQAAPRRAPALGVPESLLLTRFSKLITGQERLITSRHQDTWPMSVSCISRTSPAAIRGGACCFPRYSAPKPPPTNANTSRAELCAYSAFLHFLLPTLNLFPMRSPSSVSRLAEQHSETWLVPFVHVPEGSHNRAENSSTLYPGNL